MLSPAPTNTSVDWSASAAQATIVDPGASLSAKMAAYADWATWYDRDAAGNSYVGADLVAKKICDLLPQLARGGDGARGRGGKVRLLDAGCGTGLVVEKVREILGGADGGGKGAQEGVEFIGADYSEEMMAQARKKRVYDELVFVDVTKALDMRAVELCCAVGLFLDGQCGPDALANLLAIVAEGGFVVITVRNLTFERLKQEYSEAIANAGAEIVDNEVKRYTGPVQANYITIRKSIKQS